MTGSALLSDTAKGIVRRHPREAGAVPDPGRRRHGRVHGPAVVAGRLAAAGARAAVLDDAADPVRDDRLGRAAGQGAADEPADAERGVRPARADLPGRPARRAARLRRRRARSRRPSRSCCSAWRSGSRPTTGSSCSRASRRRATPARATASRWRSGSSARAGSSRSPRCCSASPSARSRRREVVFIKELGVGTALAVLIDAFIVRALLVPSLMALLGRWNWWAPTSAGPAARAASGSARRDPRDRLPRTRLEHRRPPREPAGRGRGPVGARRRRARVLVGLRDRAGRRGARPARVLQRVPADRDAARPGGAARRVQGGRARAGPRARRRPPRAAADRRRRAAARRPRARVRAAAAAAPRGRSRGASCSCRCSSSTPTSRCRAAAARPTRSPRSGPGRTCGSAGPPLDVGA